MKIIKLKAENIKKLVAVEITPQGNVVRITGKNASGKTSVLDAIFWALGGQQNIQSQPIRKGEKRAAVEVDLGEMVVKRTFTQGGGTALVIENKDGLRFKSPQTLLDGLLGRLTFDPLEFMRQEPRKQFETLRTLTGVDFSKLDGMRQKTYDERTLVNRDVTRLEVQVEGIVIPKDPAPVDGKEVDVSELAGKITKAVELGKAKNGYERIAAEHAQEQASIEKDAAIVDAQIGKLLNQIEELKVSYQNHIDASKQAAEKAKEMQEAAAAIEVPDISALQSELKEAEEKNREIRTAKTEYEKQKTAVERANQEKGRLSSEHETASKKNQELTDKINTIDQEKANQIAAAKFPLEGLGFGNGEVVYNELPLSQASSAEQLRVSMAMAMSLNPKLRVIRITDGSLLDTDSMKIIEEMANGNDYQVWLEVVDESGKVGIVIEDGHVAAVN